MTIAIGILFAVCLILAGWFAGRQWELTFCYTRCRIALLVLKAKEQQATAHETNPHNRAVSSRFVVIVKSDEFCDYIADAAYGHRVSESAIQECIEPYTRDNRFTLVFDLNGEPPRILPNREKGKL